MAKDRARDDRRSVGSHEKMMGALGRAAISNVSGASAAPVSAWIKPQAVRSPNSPEAKIDAHYNKGLITAEERAQERVEVADKKQDPTVFNKGFQVKKGL